VAELGAAAPNSIAVLPFANRSAEPESVHFVDGVHDDLITQLAKISALRVISRTSVQEYRNTSKKIPQIAAELNVASVLEGAVQRSGDRLRITAQLIRASDDTHLWAENFDRKLTAENLFEVQTEIARNIAHALEATLSPKEAARVGHVPTHDLAALEAYRLSIALSWRAEAGDLDEAERHLELALAYTGDEYMLALGLTLAGDADGAIALLERLYAKPAGWYVLRLDLDPLFAPLHAEPRFLSMMARYRKFLQL